MLRSGYLLFGWPFSLCWFITVRVANSFARLP
jgi:hypothetical protein